MLSAMRISAKMMMIIVLLSLICVAIATVSVTAMNAMSEATDEIDLTSREIRAGGLLGRMVVALNRGEYRLAANPGEFETITADIGNTRKRLDEALNTAHGTAGPEQKRLLTAVDGALAAYLEELDASIAMARKLGGDAVMSDAQRAILKSVQGGRDEADALIQAVVAYIDYTDHKGTRISQEASELGESRSTLLIAVAVGGIALGVALGAIVSHKGIVSPIMTIVACLRGLSEGRLETAIVGVERRDEVGDIARTAQVFKENLIRTRKMEEDAKLAEERSREERRRATLELADRFERQVGGIVNHVGSAATELQATATQLAAAVEEVTAQSVVVSAASEEASASVQTVAAASEEMSAAIGELSNRVEATANRSKDAAAGAAAAQRELDALSGAIEQVDQIVAAINSVAAQTNLLALNATIEAARAGEAGRGFAVVASEVKNLANQTHNMTEQIGSQIDAVKSASDRTVEAMRVIIGQVTEIDQATAEMASSVAEQSAATGEISRNAQQAATGVSEVSSNISHIQQAGEQTGGASNNVKIAADTLAGQSAMLKREVDNFLHEVRAA